MWVLCQHHSAVTHTPKGASNSDGGEIDVDDEVFLLHVLATLSDGQVCLYPSYNNFPCTSLHN